MFVSSGRFGLIFGDDCRVWPLPPAVKVPPVLQSAPHS